MGPDRQSVAAQVAEMRRIGSDIQLVEVKESVGKLPASMGETISAFSNGSGGLVILGLSEKNGFRFAEGFDAKKVADAFAEICSNKMEPPVRPETDIIQFEGHDIFVAAIEGLDPLDKPCYIRERGMYKGSYIRVSDGDHRLSSYEIDRLLENKEQPIHDIEIIPEATPGDLDQGLLGELISRQRKLHPKVFASQSDEEMLLNLRVLGRTGDGNVHPTLAGLLALGTYPQHFFPRLTVKLTVFDATGEATASQTAVGPIPVILEEITTAIEGSTDYPVSAVREAITNALMHRDYSPAARGTQIQVNLYADRLEILSPGGLFGTVTVDDIEEMGRASMRNQFLASILEATPFGDGFVAGNRGTGFPLMQGELAQAGLAEPRVTADLAMFTITFYEEGAVPEVVSEKGEGDSGTGSETQSLGPIEACLAQLGEAGAAEIAEHLGMSRSTVNYQLKKLVDAGSIERLGTPRSPRQRYRLQVS